MNADFMTKITDRMYFFNRVFDDAVAAYPPSQPSPARGEGVYGLCSVSAVVVTDQGKTPFPPCGGKGWGWGVQVWHAVCFCNSSKDT